MLATREAAVTLANVCQFSLSSVPSAYPEIPLTTTHSIFSSCAALKTPETYNNNKFAPKSIDFNLFHCYQIVIKDFQGTRDLFWKVTLHIIGAELVPAASPRFCTIQPLRLYPYSLHMYMKYWSVYQ